MSTALAARRRAMAKRGRPAKLPRADAPAVIVGAYARELVALSRAMDAAIMEELVNAGVLPRSSGDTARADSFVLRDVFELLVKAITDRLAKLVNARTLQANLARIGGRVEMRAAQAWQAQYRAALGIDPRADPNAAKRLDQWRRENLRLITALSRDKVRRVSRVLRESNAGERAEDIAAKIVRTTGATESHARLIARDQVAKLNSQAMREKHEDAGITEYVWSTSLDERVRDEHRELDGKRFKYAEPPVTNDRGERNNPGEDIQCRCVAVPVIPGFND